MTEFENNAYFWQKLDTIYLSSKLEIDRPKDSVHYKYSNLIYPVDYGYLKDTTGTDMKPIDVFKGSLSGNQVQAVAISADILKKDSEVKLMVGCSEDEIYDIMAFLNQTEFQKAVLLRRGYEVPEWGSDE